MCQILDERCPDSAPHKAYIGFRYASPLTEDTIDQMEK
jgi:ferrochelatase